MYATKQGNLPSVNLKHDFRISRGPSSVCSCCGSLHFMKSVVVLKREKLCFMVQSYSNFVDQACEYSSKDTEYFCKNCNLYIKEGRIPKIALCHGLAFPVIIPHLLGLTTIKQRLISHSYKFMNIKSLGRERQHGLHRIYLNVPIDFKKTVEQLKSTFLQSETIQLQLFRKMSYKALSVRDDKNRFSLRSYSLPYYHCALQTR